MCESTVEKWWITISDDMGLLKFRTKWHPFKQMVTAAWLKFVSEVKKNNCNFALNIKRLFKIYVPSERGKAESLEINSDGQRPSKKHG